MKTIDELINAAGGTTQLAAQLNLHANAVERWKFSGVPLRHWEPIILRYKLNAETLYQIWKTCNKSK